MTRVVSIALILALATAVAGAVDRYDFGNPSPDEEAMRQAIQRARNDPEAEADRLSLDNTHAHDVPNETYDVGEGITNDGVADQADYWARYHGPRQYLAWSAPLNTAAGNHADDMHVHSFFSHYTSASSYGYTGGGFPDGDAPADRGWAEGYANHFVGENIAVNNSAGVWTPQAVHDSFFTEPDFVGRGHRRNMLHSYWREVGVGYVMGPPNGIGWTDHWAIDFGSDAFASRLPPDPWPPIDTVYATGVVHVDANSDGLYQVGEQLADKRVFARTGGQWLKHYAVTAEGGGYSIPLLDAAGNDLAAGTQVELIFLDPLLKTVYRVTETIASGDVVFEDDESETPDPFHQRFNIGRDAVLSNFSPVLMADADFDDTVGIFDLAVLANNYAQSNREWIEGDFTGDGAVNVLDLAQLANHYGETAGGSTVPGPATLLLLSLGAGMLLRRRAWCDPVAPSHPSANAPRPRIPPSPSGPRSREGYNEVEL